MKRTVVSIDRLMFGDYRVVVGLDDGSEFACVAHCFSPYQQVDVDDRGLITFDPPTATVLGFSKPETETVRLYPIWLRAPRKTSFVLFGNEAVYGTKPKDFKWRAEG